MRFSYICSGCGASRALSQYEHVTVQRKMETKCVDIITIVTGNNNNVYVYFGCGLVLLLNQFSAFGNV